MGQSVENNDLNFDLNDLDLNERSSVVSGKSSSVDLENPDLEYEDQEFKRTLSCPDSMMLKDLSLQESQDNH